MPTMTLQSQSESAITIEAIEEAFYRKQQPPLADPVLARVCFGHRQQFFPLGFPLELTSNCAQILPIAAESWSGFTQLFDTAPFRLQVGVIDAGRKTADGAPGVYGQGESVCPPAPSYRVQEHLLSMVADEENFGMCDLSTGFCSIWLSPAALAHPSYIRYFFLEAAALTQLAALRATPVHGACIARHGRGILLCGDSGAGKSTLAYAAARAGWTYINDDASFILHDRDDRKVVGNCRQARFRPEGERLFPELRGLSVVQRTDASKPSLELFTAYQPSLCCAATAQIDCIVFLNRRQAPRHQMLPYPKEIARAFMEQALFSSEARSRQLRSIDRLLGAEVYELHYQELGWAVDQLDRLFVK